MSKDDSLPFVEKYRPKKLDDILYHDNIVSTLKKTISDKKYNVPHFLFYGPPGTGKTSTIETFLSELYGKHVEEMTMNINASEERGIRIVREKIIPFVSTQSITTDTKDIPKFKFIILDEADAMTLEAQAIMRQVIEKYTFNARFCLICNCIKKINDAIQSRCTKFNFSPLNYDNIKLKVDKISEEIGVKVTDDGMKKIWKLSNGDMRKVMHSLQILSINNNIITSDIVTNSHNYPTNNIMNDIYHFLTNNTNLKNNIYELETFFDENSYLLSDIIKELTEIIVHNTINKKIDFNFSREIIKKMADIEINIISTTNTDIQLKALVCAFFLLKNKN
jgi:replication factor C subunit 3/5